MVFIRFIQNIWITEFLILDFFYPLEFTLIMQISFLSLTQKN